MANRGSIVTNANIYPTCLISLSLPASSPDISLSCSPNPLFFPALVISADLQIIRIIYPYYFPNFI